MQNIHEPVQRMTWERFFSMLRDYVGKHFSQTSAAGVSEDVYEFMKRMDPDQSTLRWPEVHAFIGNWNLYYVYGS